MSLKQNYKKLIPVIPVLILLVSGAIFVWQRVVKKESTPVVSTIAEETLFLNSDNRTVEQFFLEEFIVGKTDVVLGKTEDELRTNKEFIGKLSFNPYKNAYDFVQIGSKLSEYDTCDVVQYPRGYYKFTFTDESYKTLLIKDLPKENYETIGTLKLTADFEFTKNTKISGIDSQIELSLSIDKDQKTAKLSWLSSRSRPCIIIKEIK